MRKLNWEKVGVQLNVRERVDRLAVLPPVPGGVKAVIVATDLDTWRQYFA